MKNIPLYLVLIFLFASYTLSGTYHLKMSTLPFQIKLHTEGELWNDKESHSNAVIEELGESIDNCNENSNTYFNLISNKGSKRYWNTSNSWFVHF